MTALPIIAAAVVAVGLLLTVRAALFGPASLVRRVVLATLRTGLLLLVAGVALRPSFTLNRLAPPPGPPVILLDNSRSMNLFLDAAGNAYDSVVGPVAERPRVPVYLFGDSLRLLRSGQRPGFDDRRSYVPESAPAPLRNSQRIVLLSDGAWSNARLPQSFLADNDVRCIALRQRHQPGWLTVETAQQRIESRQGDTCGLQLVVTARTSRALQYTVRCMRASAPVYERMHALPAGLSRDTIVIRLPTSVPGAALCRVTAAADSLTRTAHAVHIVTPERLRPASYAAQPRLDSRFLGRALRANGQWQVLRGPDSAASPHLLVLYDWDSTASRRLRTLAPGGMCLFAGSLPCGGETLRRLSDCLITPAETGTGASDLSPAAVPPPATIRLCAPHAPRFESHVFLRTRVERGEQEQVPLVISGVWQQRPFVAILATGFWRWDFAGLRDPAASNTTSPFSSAVLAIARERLVANLTRNLVVFPAESPLAEGRPVRLLALFPAGDDWGQVSQLRVVAADSAGDTLRDTTVQVDGGASRADIDLGLLAQGAYRCSAAMRRRSGAFTFSDTLVVEPDRTEEYVDGQNTHLLSQFGRIVELSPRSIEELLTAAPPISPDRTVPVTFRIEPTWYLLAMLLAMLALEWLLRRVWQLDR